MKTPISITKKIVILLLLTVAVAIVLPCRASYILIPMDEVQKNHLKSYGIAYWVLSQNGEISWLLNYRGGTFMMQHDSAIERECKLRGVSYEVITDGQSTAILSQIADPSVNQDVVRLQKEFRAIALST